MKTSNVFLKECERIAAPLGLNFNSRKGISAEINVLADEYCKAMDLVEKYSSMDENEVDYTELAKAEKDKEMYFAALAIRFWKSMTNLYERVHKSYSAPEFTYEDLPSTFLARLNKACKYRAWQKNPDELTEEELVKIEEDKRRTKKTKKLNAQQCINMVINTHFYELTGGIMKFDKKKSNILTKSMNTVIGTDKDGNDKTLEDTLADQNSCPTALGVGISIEMIIQDYFRKNKYDQAIIIDAIGHTNSTVPRYLRALDDNSINFYCERYQADRNIVETTVNNFHKYSSPQLNKCIENTLSTLRAAMM